ncbi:hypothetical protein [Sulfuricaulis sp.]|jgi:hypothetical protein|uniref:hypothetical protein n=1 Tax=Sulfuricaulis sp. TaxID=2003553 RepID=UPI003559BC5B
MKSVRNVVYACFALFLGTSASHADSLTGTMLIDPGTKGPGSCATPANCYVSGSYFAMGADNPNSSAAMLQPTVSPDPGGIVLGTYQNFVLNPDVPHPYNWNGLGASAGTGFSGTPTTLSNMLSPFAFFGVQTYVGTNPVSYQSGDSHPAPTADVNMGSCVGSACTLTMDLSSWEVMWNGSAFEQGPRPDNTGPFVPAVGTYDVLTHAYSLSWASQINGGPFGGVTGYWHLEGTVVPTTVPIPGAVWLLASGLIGLFGVVRKKPA